MSNPQDPGVVITTTQMYGEVRELSRKVDRIETKLDAILNDNQEIKNDLADHETRLRSLERARWPMPTIGILAGVAGAVTGALALYR